MEHKQSILFDLDDTLVHCNKYFIAVLNQFADWMGQWFGESGYGKKDFKQKQLDLDLKGIDIHGFQVDRFPQSLVDTYRFFANKTGRKTSSQEELKLLQLGQSVYDYPAEPYPAMKEILEKLRRKGHQLYLYTGGDEEIQHKKVKRAGLDDIFGERIFVAQHKNRSYLESIISAHRLDRANTWMIGNSAKTDILPALEAGIHAIHIPAVPDWEYNIVDIDIEPKGAFLTLESLTQIPDAIDRHIMEDQTG